MSPAGDDEGEVVVDVVFEDGLLFVAVANLGDRPAYRVSCAFDRPLHGLGGGVTVSELPLFRNIEFLGPGKEIRTLLDASAAYFRRREPTKLAVTVRYRDASGRRRERVVRHDLAIYRDLAYPVRSADSAASWRATR